MNLYYACDLFLKLSKAKKNWVAGAVVIENNNGEILLLLRGPSAPWMPSKWNLPGGTSEEGEDPKQTAIRETEEETQLHVHGLQILYKEQIEDGEVYFYYTRDYSGNFGLNWENTDFNWVSKNDAMNYNLVPGVKTALQNLMSDNQ